MKILFYFLEKRPKITFGVFIRVNADSKTMINRLIKFMILDLLI